MTCFLINNQPLSWLPLLPLLSLRTGQGEGPGIIPGLFGQLWREACSHS